MTKKNNEGITKAICNKGSSGNSSILPLSTPVSIDRESA